MRPYDGEAQLGSGQDSEVQPRPVSCIADGSAFAIIDARLDFEAARPFHQ